MTAVATTLTMKAATTSWRHFSCQFKLLEQSATCCILICHNVPPHNLVCHHQNQLTRNKLWKNNLSYIHCRNTNTLLYDFTWFISGIFWTLERINESKFSIQMSNVSLNNIFVNMPYSILWYFSLLRMLFSSLLSQYTLVWMDQFLSQSLKICINLKGVLNKNKYCYSEF